MMLKELKTEIRGYVGYFEERLPGGRRQRGPESARRWRAVLSRLDGQGGFTDAELADWLEQGNRYHWPRVIATLPKVIAYLAANPDTTPEEADTGLHDNAIDEWFDNLAVTG